MARASFTLKRFQPLNPPQGQWIPFTSTSGSGASTDGSPLLINTATLEVLIRLSLTDWTPTSSQTFMYKGATGQFSLKFEILGSTDSGKLRLTLSSDGTNTASATSSVATGFTDNTTNWVRATWRASDGLVQFFTAAPSEAEPSTWTQLGLNQTISTTTVSESIYDSTAALVLGETGINGGNKIDGLIERAIIKEGEQQSGIDYFYFTGAPATWTTPTGVTSAEAILWGAGWGGYTCGVMSVTPGETLTIRVGGVPNGRIGGWPNGGDGGENTASGGSFANGGCGGTDIKSGATTLMVAGGNGGDVENLLTGSNVIKSGVGYGSGGGTGDNSTGYTPVINTPNGTDGATLGLGGRGGRQTVGGNAGSVSSLSAQSTNVTVSPTAGTAGQGGNGASTNSSGAVSANARYCGAGGGGGHYGGGGGGLLRGAGSTRSDFGGGNGGGGSSYVNTSRVTNYKFSLRWDVGSSSWYATGARNLSSGPYRYVPRIITNTTNDTSSTSVTGPPQGTGQYDRTAWNGLVAIRWSTT